MSRKADCWDNTPMESFFGSMKTELDDASGYQTRQAARTGLFQFIKKLFELPPLALGNRLHNSNAKGTASQRPRRP